MVLPRLQSCCLVLDLKTGNIVMGCLNAFLSFVMFVMMIVVAVTVDSEESAEEKQVAVQVAEKLPSLVIEEQAELAGLYAMSIILVLMFLAKFLFDLLFVYGVMSERRGIIKAYFIMWLVFFLLSMFTFSINIVSYNAGTITMELIYIGINIYCILLSYSFYKQLNEREEV